MEAFKEHTTLVGCVCCVYCSPLLVNNEDSLFYRFFTENRGWTLPALFYILRDLRDLAFDVCRLPLPQLNSSWIGCLE